MQQDSQTATHRARAGRATPSKPKPDTRQDTCEAVASLPEAVTVAVSELAGELEEGLLALAVGTGLQVLSAFMEAEVTELVGPKGRWNRERTAVRHGAGDGEVTLGGRRVPVRRPRVRTADHSAEVPLESYERFNTTDMLGRLAMERMLAKLSTRRYRTGLEPVGAAVEARGAGDVALGGLSPLQGRDRDRARRAARGRPLRAGPGRAHGGRRPLRRPHLRRRHGHRRRRREAPARRRGG